MPVNFDFNDLYAFRALMEYGSFRLAAESICLSQSALSRRIEKLETALGNRLFDRTTRRVTSRCMDKILPNVRSSCWPMSRRCWRISASQQGAHRAGDGGDSAFRRLLLYAGNNPQLSGALSPGAHPVD